MGAKAMSRGSAFYAKQGGPVGDVLTLLHPPYTAWNMSYVALGAVLAPSLEIGRLLLTLAAFFAGTGIASHALDELNGRPLNTGLSIRQLKIMAVLGLGLALTATLAGAVIISPWILLFAAIGVVLVFAYTLEWGNGLIHTDLGFALSWGAFPVVVGYWAQAESFSLPMWVVAGAATLLSLAQRSLSTPARFFRRRTTSAAVAFRSDRGEEQWDDLRLLASWERPLRLLSWTMVILTVGLVLARLEM